jgi:hypothetical protein
MARPFQTETDLMDRLAHAQNHPCFAHQDIMTWAAMCDDRAELEAHVVRNEQQAARWVPPTRKGLPRRRKAA